MVDLTDRQVEVEALMARLGYERYWSQLGDAKEKGEYALRTDTGRHLLREMVWKTRDELDRYVKRSKSRAGNVSSVLGETLKRIGTGVAALIACKMLVDQITMPRSFSSLCMATGHRLEDELLFREIKKRSKRLFEKMLARTERGGYDHRRTVMIYAAQKAGEALERLPRDVLARVGLLALEAVFEATDLFEREVKLVGRKSKVFINTAREVLEWVERSQTEHEMLRPFYMPTVDPPLEWQGLHGGGYHTDVVMRRPLVKFQRWKQVERARPGDYALTALACNALQECAWQANELVLEAASSIWGDGIECPMLPTRMPRELPPKPKDIATNEDARKRWRRDAGETYTFNTAETGRRVGVARTLFVARTYRERAPFYFPHYADFRGRLYARPLFLDPQGTDLARALLQFHRPKALGDHGLFWLGIHGANCFGLDKKTLEERESWCHEQRQEIQAVHTDPLDTRAWWQEAEKPWQFLAFCGAWGDALREGAGYGCRIPVHADGTNNGWQIYSLLARDEVGAEITNVLPGDTPRDAYAEVAAIATLRLEHIAAGKAKSLEAKWTMTDREAFAEERRWAGEILRVCGGAIPRECTKRTTMSKTYGLRRWSADRYVREWIDTISPPDEWNGTYRAAHLLGPIVWNSIKARTGLASGVMDWLRGMAKTLAQAGFPLCWNTPSGFGVIQDYRKQRTDTIQTTLRKSIRRSITLRSPLPEMAVVAQADGFAPNYVHSLDAACVTKYAIAMRAAGCSEMSTVHDGFSSHAAEAGISGAIIRQTYATVFAEDQLRLVKRQLEFSSGIDLPEPPEYGELDPSCITRSRYAFT